MRDYSQGERERERRRKKRRKGMGGGGVRVWWGKKTRKERKKEIGIHVYGGEKKNCVGKK